MVDGYAAHLERVESGGHMHGVLVSGRLTMNHQVGSEGVATGQLGGGVAWYCRHEAFATVFTELFSTAWGSVARFLRSGLSISHQYLSRWPIAVGPEALAIDTDTLRHRAGWVFFKEERHITAPNRID